MNTEFALILAVFLGVFVIFAIGAGFLPRLLRSTSRAPPAGGAGYHESILARLLNRQIAGLGAAKDFRDVNVGIIGLERRRTARLLASVR